MNKKDSDEYEYIMSKKHKETKKGEEDSTHEEECGSTITRSVLFP